MCIIYSKEIINLFGINSIKLNRMSDFQIDELWLMEQDVDQFMKEMEEVHKQKEIEREANLQKRLAKYVLVRQYKCMKPPPDH